MVTKKGSKNNVSNRGKSAKMKYVKGKAIKPIMYIGERLRHGNYMAAQLDSGELIKDNTGKPIPYKII